EVQGTLTNISDLPGGPVTLSLRDGEQTFRATANSALLATSFQHLEKGSLLRLRGVCMYDTEYTGNFVPFTLILASAEDVRVLNGPPWWSMGHLIELALAMLGLGFLIHLLYSRAEQWKLHAVLDERERLAHEMHDTLAQSYAGIGFQLRAIRNRLSRGKSVEVSLLLEELDAASEMVRHSHGEARRSLAALRPEAIQAAGLPVALEQSARSMIAHGLVSLEVQSSGEARDLPIHVLDTLFRIGQESIANALQHAHPTHLWIAVAYAPTFVSLTIVDDGVGFSIDPAATGFGLTGMRSRAESIGATITIESSPDNGTRIFVRAPLPRRASWFRRLAYIEDGNQEFDDHAS
ncbi:MAG TPA: histidine kinase, partial [Acidobacteriaceae bacterium]|nr:histidine kinase [Acidobacteriaceae bacterium]